MPFTQIFLQHTGGARAGFAGVENLESTLGALAAKAVSAWPDVAIAPGDFVRHLAEKLAGAVDPAGALNSAHVGDLYLALGCLRGDDRALRLFDEHFLAATIRYVARSERNSGFTDELAQRLRTRLFMAQEGSPPRIATYTGQGPLGGWLRTVASRLAIDMWREDKQHLVVDHEVLEIRAPGLDPELDYMKTLYRDELKQAFRATLSALSVQEDNILRLHFLEGITVQALAGLYRTSRNTMNRRIAGARQRVLDETRRLLAARLSLPESQVNTLMAMAGSQMHSVVREIFESPEAPKKSE